MAELKDIPLLEEVERSAATAFFTLPDYVLSDRIVSRDLLREMVEAKNLWAAVTDDDRPVEFVGCMNMGNIVYIHEISVARGFQKMGIGRRPML